ncbi:MAG: FdtA/QdtA family cupin domain-containing protein [Bacteroidaceae bacterium]|nr:FdtA/QdtA family cupin domain-containing protein [Bacteroidaceae bacterium]
MSQNLTLQLPKGCFVVRLPKVSDERGALAFGEAERHIPFPIRRVFWTYNIKGGNMRGDHAHRTCEMVLFPIGGSFDIELDDGEMQEVLHMDDPSTGVFIPPLVWCRLMNFTRDAACISLASEEYRAEDYIHDYEEFIRMKSEE